MTLNLLNLDIDIQELFLHLFGIFVAGLMIIQRLVAPEFASADLQYENKFYCLAAAAALIKYIEFTEKFTFAKNTLKVDFQVTSILSVED